MIDHSFAFSLGFHTVYRFWKNRVEDFRDSIGAVGIEWDGNAGGLVGLEALQKRVQDRGRKAIDEKIAAFQVSHRIALHRVANGSCRILLCFIYLDFTHV